MRVFITGVAGFLGSHLAEHYLARGSTVAGIDSLLGGELANVPDRVEFVKADCNNRDDYMNLLDGADLVYHCAAAPYEGLSVFSPTLVYQNTLMSTVATLSAAASTSVSRFVFCSSMARYGNQESPFHEGLAAQPTDPYGLAKVAAEAALKSICETHGMEWTIAVPHNIYGPRQRYVDPFRNVVSIMINRMLQGQQPIIYGDGSQRRCFSYIADVIEPLARLGDSPRARSQIVNVGPDDGEVTIVELAMMIGRLLTQDVHPIFVDPRPLEVHTANCSGAKARRLLGYSPRWTLEAGLEATIAYIRQAGPRPFEYHLPIEILSDRTPATWTQQHF